jgi:hypothetical protein
MKNYLFSFLMLILASTRSADPLMTTSSLFGYQTGNAFNLVGNSSYFIQQIIVQSGQWLNIIGIQLQFSNGINSYLSPYIGGTGVSGSSSSSFFVPNDQFISSVYVCSVWGYVVSIQFTTNQEIQSPTYGTIWNPSLPFNCSMINLQSGLLGLTGYSTTCINGLSFISSAPIKYTFIAMPSLAPYSSSLLI